MAVAFLLVSVARAEDPPIVSVGTVSSNGNTASGDVGSGGTTNACLNDDHSQADPSASDSGSAVKLNQGSCQAGSSSGTGGSQTGSGSQAPGSTRGVSGSTKSSASATAWVTSANAVGLRIVRVRHVTKGVSVTKRFRVLVTLRDVRGKLVRDAIVTISRVPGAQSTISGKYSTFSNRFGQATIRVPVAKRMLGKRLFLKISARTPKAHAIALRSVRVPALG